MTANRQGTCRRTKSEFKGAIGNLSPGAPLAKAGNELQRSTRVRSGQIADEFPCQSPYDVLVSHRLHAHFAPDGHASTDTTRSTSGSPTMVARSGSGSVLLLPRARECGLRWEERDVARGGCRRWA